LRSQAYAQLVLDVASWLADTAVPTPVPAEPVQEFALRLIRKRHKRLLADAKGIERRSAAERHAVRIDAKRLRYAVDGFASLLREKRVDPYLEALAALQDLLGTSNDAATATRLLTEVSPSPSFTAFARGWLASRIDGEVRAVGVLVDKLAAAKKVWS
jgi:CHAD domain-containing protein